MIILIFSKLKKVYIYNNLIKIIIYIILYRKLIIPIKKYYKYISQFLRIPDKNNDDKNIVKLKSPNEYLKNFLKYIFILLHTVVNAYESIINDYTNEKYNSIINDEIKNTKSQNNKKDKLYLQLLVVLKNLKEQKKRTT